MYIFTKYTHNKVHEQILQFNKLKVLSSKFIHKPANLPNAICAAHKFHIMQSSVCVMGVWRLFLQWKFVKINGMMYIQSLTLLTDA